MVGLRQRVEAQEAAVHAIPYTQWYRSAISSTEKHPGLIDNGEALASVGPVRVAEELDATATELAGCLQGAGSGLIIPLNSIPGKGVRSDDFLKTRFVEITVHGHDIATKRRARHP